MFILEDLHIAAPKGGKAYRQKAPSMRSSAAQVRKFGQGVSVPLSAVKKRVESSSL